MHVITRRGTQPAARNHPPEEETRSPARGVRGNAPVKTIKRDRTVDAVELEQRNCTSTLETSGFEEATEFYSN